MPTFGMSLEPTPIFVPSNEREPHGMCYSHYGNKVHNGAISIAQWGLLSDCYKVNPIGQ